jgi:hypothetical protein
MRLITTMNLCPFGVRYALWHGRRFREAPDGGDGFWPRSTGVRMSRFPHKTTRAKRAVR